MFENPDVDLTTVPEAEKAHWHQLAVRFRYERLVQAAALLAAVALVIVFSRDAAETTDPFNLLFLAAATVFAIGVLVHAWLAVSFMGYAVREHDVLYRSGIVWRRQTTVPFSRIQHVEFTRGPLERVFRLATVELYTAGGAGADLKIAGLTADDASRLRRYILRRVETDHDDG